MSTAIVITKPGFDAVRLGPYVYPHRAAQAARWFASPAAAHPADEAAHPADEADPSRWSTTTRRFRTTGPACRPEVSRWPS